MEESLIKVDLEELGRRQKRKAGEYTLAEIDFGTLENRQKLIATKQ